MLASADQQRLQHGAVYARNDGVQRLVDQLAVDNGEYVEPDSRYLDDDSVARIVVEYGELDTKIESLAQLRVVPGYRAELAMLSLGRSYAYRCCELGGRWTSGLHLFWWTRDKLEREPVPQLLSSDLRYQSAASLKRQVELAQWRLMMFRLVFISDIGAHAERDGHPIMGLADLAERAAEETETPNVHKLRTWIRTRALPEIGSLMPEKQYRRMARELHVDRRTTG